MDKKYIRYIFISAFLVVVLVVSFAVVKQPSEKANTNTTFNLQAPQFVGIAKAEMDSIASFMEDEAGISSYFKASTSIALNDVRDAFRTIEVETANYIIGSVPVTDYPESEDVHVYVHTDGWVVAYYLAADPVGKIFDWRVYHSSGRTAISTKLETVLLLMATEAAVAFPGGTYYDFRYPNATNLMLIAEWANRDSVAQTDSFEVNVPGTFLYYERSWSIGSDDFDSAKYFLDSVEIFRGNYNEWGTAQGFLTATQLLPDQYHLIEVKTHPYGAINYVYGGLAILYREP